MTPEQAAVYWRSKYAQSEAAVEGLKEALQGLQEGVRESGKLEATRELLRASEDSLVASRLEVAKAGAEQARLMGENEKLRRRLELKSADLEASQELLGVNPEEMLASYRASAIGYQQMYEQEKVIMQIHKSKYHCERID